MNMAQIAFYSVEVLTEKEIKHLRYELLIRFSEILYSPKRSETIIKATEDIGRIANTGKLYIVENRAAFYGGSHFIEQDLGGPGLHISGLLIYLCRHPAVEGVFYGDEDYIERVYESDAISLLDMFLEEGIHKHKIDTANEQMCDYCDKPMIAGAVYNNEGKPYGFVWKCEACDSKRFETD